MRVRTRFTDARVGDAGIAAIFADERRWQRYLDVEAALALAEADVGLIPAADARAIAAAARIGMVDLDRVRSDVDRLSHPLMGLIAELSRVVGEPAARWVHWGATTQNITQTGDVLALREAHARLVALLGDVLHAAADRAEAGAELVMAGRTHGQHAVPITFGFKVAIWIDQLLRHRERLLGLGDRLFRALVGGAAGTFAALGDDGPEVQAAVAARLGLLPMDVPARSIADPFAELVCTLAMLATTGGAVAAEVALLMEVEFGELAEPTPAGVVGSSTMPHKRNPQLCQDVVALAAELRALVPLALEGMAHSHEVDAARTMMMDDAVVDACVIAGDLLLRLTTIVAGLTVDAARMRANVALTGGFISSEAVMLGLGRIIGRQPAHEAVGEAVAAARDSGGSFAEAVAAHPRVAGRLDDERLAALLDPGAHVGLSARIARETAARARSAVGRAPNPLTCVQGPA
jgi:3-carboxy-cis,cis-muconate cycloisomerase